MAGGVCRHFVVAGFPSEACSKSRRDWRGCWQVFGLAGVSGATISPARLLAHLPGSWGPVVLGVRSCLPLRGSPGLAPGSLLRAVFEAARPAKRSTRYGAVAALSI